MPDKSLPRIDIVATETEIRTFAHLLANGLRVLTLPGISVYNLLAETMEIDNDYLQNGIQTVLVDGKPVDDMVSCILYEPSTIALSAALPGLFGAAFRKDGHFSALRRHYSGSEPPPGKTDATIRITVKLFNMVAERIGPSLLSKGVMIGKEDFIHFWKSRPGHINADMTVRLNGEKVSPAELADKLLPHGSYDDDMSLKVIAGTYIYSV